MAAILAVGFGAGCVGAPTPLVPTLEGSVGTPSHGVVTKAEALPQKGKAHRRLRSNGRKYGTPALIRTIIDASLAVDREIPGPPLVLGDIGARRGGGISGHRSHRAGRDVDILFYLTTPDGRPIRSPGFIPLGSDGLGKIEKTGEYVLLDVERTWLLVKALTQSPHAPIQWLFVARSVEGLLIRHAMALGEDWDLIWQAENMMHQPSDSASHNDHFHMRVGCTHEERVAGCHRFGPSWPWWPNAPRDTRSKDRDLISALMSDELKPQKDSHDTWTEAGVFEEAEAWSDAP